MGPPYVRLAGCIFNAQAFYPVKQLNPHLFKTLYTLNFLHEVTKNASLTFRENTLAGPVPIVIARLSCNAISEQECLSGSLSLRPGTPAGVL